MAIVFGALLVGYLCGLIPYYAAKRRGQTGLATQALVVCTVSGLGLGFVLALPVALVYTWVIRKKGTVPGATAQVGVPDTPSHGAEFRPCPKCAEPIRLEASVCRFCRHEFSAEEVASAVQEHQAALGAATSWNAALVRLQRLHGDIASARPGTAAGCATIFVSGLLGLLALILAVAGLQSLHVSDNWSVPAALAISFAVWIGLALLLRRDAARKAGHKEVALRQQLADAVQETASAMPTRVASVGGPEALSDDKRFKDLLLASRSTPGA